MLPRFLSAVRRTVVGSFRWLASWCLVRQQGWSEGKQIDVTAKYLQTARFYAETNRRNEAVETLEDYIVSDVE
jgi:hypothetical protein